MVQAGFMQNSSFRTHLKHVRTFLFAKYNKWFGAVKSSVLRVILGNVAQLMVTPFGMLSKEITLLPFPWFLQ